MNDELTTNLIRQHLDSSSEEIDQPTLMRLSYARMQALARYDAYKSQRKFAWGNVLVGYVNSTETYLRNYFRTTVMLCFVLFFSGVIYWQNVVEQDSTELDVAILTDDLPIDAYVD